MSCLKNKNSKNKAKNNSKKQAKRKVHSKPQKHRDGLSQKGYISETPPSWPQQGWETAQSAFNQSSSIAKQAFNQSTSILTRAFDGFTDGLEKTAETIPAIIQSIPKISTSILSSKAIPLLSFPKAIAQPMLKHRRSIMNPLTQNQPDDSDYIQQMIKLAPSEWYTLYDHIEPMIQTCLDQKTRNQLSRKDQNQFFHFLKDALGMGGKVKLSEQSMNNLLTLTHRLLMSHQYDVTRTKDIDPLHDLFNALLRIDTPDQDAQHAILTQVSQYAERIARIAQPFEKKEDIRNMQNLIWMLHVNFDWYIHKVANTISSDKIKDLFKKIEKLNSKLHQWNPDEIFLFQTALKTNRRMRNTYRNNQDICKFLDQSTQTFVQELLRLVERQEIRFSKEEIQQSVYIEYMSKLNLDVQQTFNPQLYQRVVANDVFPYPNIYTYTIPNSNIQVRIFYNKLPKKNKAIVEKTLTNTYQRMEEFKRSIGLLNKDDKRNPLFDLYLFDDHEHYVKYGPIWDVNTAGGGYAHVIHRDSIMAYEAFIYQQPEGDPRDGKDKEGHSFRNLGHEIQHQFSYALVGARNLHQLPSWMIEGMANTLGNEPCFNEEAQYIRTATIKKEPKKMIHMGYGNGADLYYFGSTLFQFMKDRNPQLLRSIFQAAQNGQSEEVNRLVKEWGEAPATNTAYAQWLDNKIMDCIPEEQKIKDPSSLKEGGQVFLNSVEEIDRAIQHYKKSLRFDFNKQGFYYLNHTDGFQPQSPSQSLYDQSAMNKIWAGLLIYGTECKLEKEIPGINRQDCQKKTIDLLNIERKVYDELRLNQTTFMFDHKNDQIDNYVRETLTRREWLNNPKIQALTENRIKQYNPSFNFVDFYRQEKMIIKSANPNTNKVDQRQQEKIDPNLNLDLQESLEWRQRESDQRVQNFKEDIEQRSEEQKEEWNRIEQERHRIKQEQQKIAEERQKIAQSITNETIKTDEIQQLTKQNQELETQIEDLLRQMKEWQKLNKDRWDKLLLEQQYREQIETDLHIKREDNEQKKKRIKELEIALDTKTDLNEKQKIALNIEKERNDRNINALKSVINTEKEHNRGKIKELEKRIKELETALDKERFKTLDLQTSLDKANSIIIGLQTALQQNTLQYKQLNKDLETLNAKTEPTKQTTQNGVNSTLPSTSSNPRLSSPSSQSKHNATASSKRNATITSAVQSRTTARLSTLFTQPQNATTPFQIQGPLTPPSSTLIPGQNSDGMSSTGLGIFSGGAAVGILVLVGGVLLWWRHHKKTVAKKQNLEIMLSYNRPLLKNNSAPTATTQVKQF